MVIVVVEMDLALRYHKPVCPVKRRDHCALIVANYGLENEPLSQHAMAILYFILELALLGFFKSKLFI